jgi:hypothetical protein
MTLQKQKAGPSTTSAIADFAQDDSGGWGRVHNYSGNESLIIWGMKPC